MTSSRLVARWIAVAVASVALPSAAQIQVNQSGQARDANPRVGSGGLNQRPANLQLYTAEDVALGRVTGGRAIRANLTGDPSQPFGGRSRLPSDSFSRSANVPVSPASPTIRPGEYAVPFYSANTGVTPPSSNFRLNTYTGQFVYRPPTQLGAEDIQYGVPPGTPVIRPSAGGGDLLVMPATVRDLNGATANTMITASPLFGVRPMPALLDEDRFLLSRSGTMRPGDSVMDPIELRRLREERNRSLLSNAQLAERTRIDAEAAQQAQRDATPALTRSAELGSSALTQPPTTPAALQPGLIEPNSQNLGGRPLVAPPERPDPAARNPLLAELRRIEEERSARAAATPPPANRPTLPSDRAEPLPPGPGTPAAPGTPPTTPDAAPTTPPMIDPPAGSGSTHETRAQGTLQIGSLAERQTDEGLKQLIGSAETLVAQGRFASAIDRYEAARKFAPDDATLLVARAQAELGAGFFARADATLRQALATDPASLGGRYDLRKALTDQRTNVIVDDLKRLALDNPKDPMPVLMLGYVAYHTGDAGRAVELLSESLKRAPGDPLAVHFLNAWGAADGK